MRVGYVPGGAGVAVGTGVGGRRGGAGVARRGSTALLGSRWAPGAPGAGSLRGCVFAVGFFFGLAFFDLALVFFLGLQSLAFAFAAFSSARSCTACAA